MTRLERPLKRELGIQGKPHVLTINVDGLKITKKGRRKGLEITWQDLVSGDEAMAVALRASVGKL